MKKSLVTTKNFVKKHRVAIAVTATSVCWLYLMKKNAEQINEFLKEHDLFDKYYQMDEI